jgi:hypothetical protein
MPDDDAFAFSTSLIQRSTEKIEWNYLRALERGDVDPVVLLLALRDPRARAIAEQSGQVERIARMVEESAHRDEVPIVIVGLPLQDACWVSDGLLPGLREALGAMDAGPGYVVVAVAHGGATAVAMPPVAR